MRGEGISGIAHVEFARACPRERDQLFDVLRGQRWVTHDRLRREGDERDWHEVGVRIERQLREQSGDLRILRGSEQQCVAVGRALCHVIRADDRCRARARIDQHLLLPALRERRDDNARVRVAAAAHRKRNDEAHGLGGERLRQRSVMRRQQCCRNDRCPKHRTHGLSPQEGIEARRTCAKGQHARSSAAGVTRWLRGPHSATVPVDSPVHSSIFPAAASSRARRRCASLAACASRCGFGGPDDHRARTRNWRSRSRVRR